MKFAFSCVIGRIFACFLLLFLAAGQTHAMESPGKPAHGHNEKILADEDEINFYCLKRSYAQVRKISEDGRGDKWLELEDGRKVLYAAMHPAYDIKSLNVDVRASMAQPYPLEPDRPTPQPGMAPGRKRPYALFDALYGDNPASVKAGLATTRLFGRGIPLSKNAARAFSQAVSGLERFGLENPRQRGFLKADGGFCWRKIAGENSLSAHAYGIALDIGANKAPYWRWSRTMPHPMQLSYPGEIVKTLEDAGFIWGGKWHEYDLMHFEYRPEIICKARIRAGLDKMPLQPEKIAPAR